MFGPWFPCSGSDQVLYRPLAVGLGVPTEVSTQPEGLDGVPYDWKSSEYPTAVWPWARLIIASETTSPARRIAFPNMDVTFSLAVGSWQLAAATAHGQLPTTHCLTVD